MMRKASLLFPLLVVLVSVLTLTVGPARADDIDSIVGLELRATIQVPGNPLTKFDISWVDQPSQTYYLADRSNAGVDIVDARHNEFLTRVTGFVGADPRGNDFSGPNGVLVIHSQHQLWAGDGDSTVKVIDLKSNPPDIIDVISTGGLKRADEMAFDPKDHILLVANDAEDIDPQDPNSGPFISFISTKTHKILGTILFHNATNGLEQSVWDRATHRFYLSVPELNGPFTGPGTGGFIAEIDPRKQTITRMFPVGACEPAGLVLGPNQHLLVGCDAQETLVVDARTGAIVASTTQVGGSDEVWFNRGDGNYYLAARNNASGPVLGVIDAATNTWLGNVPTDANAHSVAVDRANNHIFVPLTPTAAAFANDSSRGLSCTNGCIGVYWSSETAEK